ncbi:MAG: hypothetical protein Q9221_006230 [Calogaya cf. arnoldii]
MAKPMDKLAFANKIWPDLPTLEDVTQKTRAVMTRLHKKDDATKAAIARAQGITEGSPNIMDKKQYDYVEFHFGKSYENSALHARTELAKHLRHGYIPVMFAKHYTKIAPASPEKRKHARQVAAYYFMHEVWFPALDYAEWPEMQDAVTYWRLQLFDSKEQTGIQWFSDEVEETLATVM